MKKFEFSLDKLKNYREQTLEIEKNNLGIMQAELIEMEKTLEEIYKIIAEANKNLTDTLARGTNPREIATIKRYISSKQQEAVTQTANIERHKIAIEKQVGVVLEKTKDVKTLLKLEEVQLEEHKAKELKEEELFIEEFVTNSDFRIKN